MVSPTAIGWPQRRQVPAKRAVRVLKLGVIVVCSLSLPARGGRSSGL
jgi:hypothetical protein